MVAKMNTGRISELESERTLTTGVAMIFACVALVGIGFLGYQALLWLRNGYWTDITVRSLLPHDIRAGVDWSGARGAEKLWNGFLDISVWLLLFIGGGLVAAWALNHNLKVDSELRQAREIDKCKYR